MVSLNIPLRPARLWRAVAVLGALYALTACATQSAYRPETPLYSSDGRAWPTAQTLQALHAIGSERSPVVVFVHGRGNEPHKSLRGGAGHSGLAVPKLEQGYDVGVLMVNWDSKVGPLDFFDRERPLSHVPAGAQTLGDVLALLEQEQQRNPMAIKPTLLVHSMGAFLVQHVVEAGRWPGSRIFSNVVFTEPDVDDRHHADWLEPLAKIERVYVTWNRDDGVLKKSTDARPAGERALGLGTDAPLAAHATYIDLTDMGKSGSQDDDHEVFGKGAMNGQVFVCRFFMQALRGESVRLSLDDNAAKIDRQVVYRLRSVTGQKDSCLTVPDVRKK